MSPETARAVWLARQYYFTLFCHYLDFYLAEDSTPEAGVAQLHKALTLTRNAIAEADPTPAEPAPCPLSPTTSPAEAPSSSSSATAAPAKPEP